MAQVVEKFVSINGEGAHAGELAAFIRFKGCNLCCFYCDTSWANDPGALFSEEAPEELARWAAEKNVLNVTLTGGEPLLQKDIARLVELLGEKGLRAEIETNGSMDISVLAGMERRPSFTLDYKLPSSGMERFMRTENFALLRRGDVVKFVVGSMEDLETAQSVIEKYSLTEKCYVYLSPVFGRIEPAKMVDFIAERGLNKVRLQLQLHKYIWDPYKRGV